MVQLTSPSSSRSSLRSYRAYNAVTPWNPHPRLLRSCFAEASDPTAATDGHDTRNDLYRLPAELFEAIVAQDLSAAELVNVGATCKRLSNLVLYGLPEIWFRLSLARFTTDDLLSCPFGEKVFEAVESGSGAESRRIYQALCRQCVCRQCGVRFSAGACGGCKKHTGVLISGHRTNGIQASWTCCGAGECRTSSAPHENLRLAFLSLGRPSSLSLLLFWWACILKNQLGMLMAASRALMCPLMMAPFGAGWDLKVASVSVFKAALARVRLFSHSHFEKTEEERARLRGESKRDGH